MPRSAFAVALAATVLVSRVSAAQASAGEVGMALPPEPAERATDHDEVIGRFAVGYLGFRQMAIGRSPAGDVEEVEAPVIGARYWLTPLVGIDAGMGLLLESRTADDETGGETTTRDAGGDKVFILHAGVPLALASSGHFTFEFVPELNIGFAGQTIEPEALAPEIDNSGFHFDVAARAGAEVHFGFIGIPQLSLQGAVGVRLAVDHTSSTVTGTPDQTHSTQRTALATALAGDPWDIFQGGISAFYYF
jgi:hypothetical protein